MDLLSWSTHLHLEVAEENTEKDPKPTNHNKKNSHKFLTIFSFYSKTIQISNLNYKPQGCLKQWSRGKEESWVHPRCKKLDVMTRSWGVATSMHSCRS